MRKLQTLQTGKPLQRLDTPHALAALAAPRLRGRRLQALRTRLLRHSPLCVICLAAGRYKAATVIDHKVPRIEGGSDDESNLQALCGPCHKVKTAAEAARRSRG